MSNLPSEIQTRLKSGAEIVSLDVGPELNPWIEFAGMFKDDPMLGDWKEAMADYRKKVDEDDDRHCS